MIENPHLRKSVHPIVRDWRRARGRFEGVLSNFEAQKDSRKNSIMTLSSLITLLTYCSVHWICAVGRAWKKIIGHCYFFQYWPQITIWSSLFQDPGHNLYWLSHPQCLGTVDRKSPSPMLETAVTLAPIICTGTNSCEEAPPSSSSMVIAIDHQGSLNASLAPSLATQPLWPSQWSSLRMRLITTVMLMTKASVLVQCFSSIRKWEKKPFSSASRVNTQQLTLILVHWFSLPKIYKWDHIVYNS
jgi:hypothetical protein